MLRTCEQRLGAPLLAEPAQLLQPDCFGCCGRPVLEICQRFTAPQHERVIEGERRTVVLSVSGERTRPVEEALERPHVDVVDPEVEPVAGRHRLDRVRTEHSPKANDGALHDLAPGRGRRVAPQRIREPLRPDDRVAIDDERAEHNPVPRRQLAGTVDCDGSERARYPHVGSIRRVPIPVKAVDTELIPGSPPLRYRSRGTCVASSPSLGPASRSKP